MTMGLIVRPNLILTQTFQGYSYLISYSPLKFKIRILFLHTGLRHA
jgi:hypothetical protein